MKPARWNDPDPRMVWGNKNLRWGSPNYLLEPGDPGYVELQPGEPGYVPPTTKTMQQDNIDITITAEAEAAIHTKINELRAAIAAFATTMTAEQIARLFKLGESRLPFHEKCSTYMQQRPELVNPDLITIAAYNSDEAARAAVLRILAHLMDATGLLERTATVLGADLLAADLAFYNYLPLQAKSGKPGAIDVLNDLQDVYPAPGRRNAPKPPKPPTP